MTGWCCKIPFWDSFIIIQIKRVKGNNQVDYSEQAKWQTPNKINFRLKMSESIPMFLCITGNRVLLLLIEGKYMAAKNKMTRSEFLKASAGLAAAGLLGTTGLSAQTARKNRVLLGKTGIEVSPLCFGAGRTQDPVLVRAALDKGVTLIDTARIYAGGQNEVMLGNGLKEFRNKVLIQTKIRARVRENADLEKAETAENIRKQLDRALAQSLKSLQTDSIDILLYHWAVSAGILFHDTVLDFFTEAKKTGKIRVCGFSVHNDHMEVLKRAVNQPFYEVIMVPYNFKGSYIHSVSKDYNEWDQPGLEKLLKTLHKQGVGILAMKTCSAGPMAIAEREKPSFRNAVRWVLDREYVDCANVAMGNFDEIEEDIQAMNSSQ